MALIKCPECGADVSDRSEMCVKCGFPIAKAVLRKCPECGADVPDRSVKCLKCGFPLQGDVGEANAAAPLKQAVAVKLSNEWADSRLAVDEDEELFGKLSDKWAWMLAIAPMLGGVVTILLAVTLDEIGVFGRGVVLFSLNTLFMVLDIKELEAKGKSLGGLGFLGFVFIPVYLFMRANKTTKEYGYAFVWCVSFAVYLGMNAVV